MTIELSTEQLQAFVKDSNALLTQLNLSAGELAEKRKALVLDFFAEYRKSRQILTDNKVEFYNKAGRVINLKNMQQLKGLLDNQLDAKTTLNTALKCFELSCFAQNQTIQRNRYEQHGNGSFLYNLLWLLHQQLKSQRSYAEMCQHIMQLEDGKHYYFEDIGALVAVNWHGNMILELNPNTLQHLNMQLDLT